MPQKSALVLFSGGQDSTAVLVWAIREFDHRVSALFVEYGQRHLKAELDAARKIAAMADVPLLRCFVGLGTAGAVSALLGNGPVKASGGLEDSQTLGGLPTSYVPARNLIFVSLAASVAVSKGIGTICIGVSEEDSSGYPDCRADAVRAMRAALATCLPSGAQVELATPLLLARKATVIQQLIGDDLYQRLLPCTHTCYEGVVGGCGRCPSCVLRAKSFEEAGIADPASVQTGYPIAEVFVPPPASPYWRSEEWEKARKLSAEGVEVNEELRKAAEEYRTGQ